LLEQGDILFDMPDLLHGGLIMLFLDLPILFPQLLVAGVVAGGDFTEFEPKMSAGERKQLLDGWKTAVQRTLSE